jgi:8-oxo-dGTP pyrophosphatase MutT (NUDIX family)
MIEMPDATLVYLLTDTEILLAMKKRGFGAGNYNGVGGKPESVDKTLRDTAVREAKEEIAVKINPDNLRKVATIDFFSPFEPDEKSFDQRVHVYFTNEWEGEPKETEEMKPAWFNIDDLLDGEYPHYNKMWPDDKYWLPRALKGEVLKGTFIFGPDGEVKRYRLDIKH